MPSVARGRGLWARLLPLPFIAISLLVAFAGRPAPARAAAWIAAVMILAEMALLTRGHLRNAMVAACSLVFGLGLAAAVLSALYGRSTITGVSDFTKSNPTFGWGPAAKGTYRATRHDPAMNAPVYDTFYTLEANGTRQTLSNPDGPTTAFLGDSFTFGQGLADRETLPQAYADLRPNVRVLNFGFPGYGPQQILRALETGAYDQALGGDLRTVVAQTAAWHIPRVACKVDFMERAPRYELRGGSLFFLGTCAGATKDFWRGILSKTALSGLAAFPSQPSYTDADLALFVSVFANAAKLVYDRYRARFVVAYMSTHPSLLPAGITDDSIIARLRAAKLDLVIFPYELPNYTPAQLFIPNDGHPSALTNQLWARLLDNHLKEEQRTAR